MSGNFIEALDRIKSQNPKSFKFQMFKLFTPAKQIIQN